MSMEIGRKYYNESSLFFISVYKAYKMKLPTIKP